jgi:hypothetical protein
MPSSGIRRSLALVRTDVSEEHIICIIRVTRIVELIKLAVTSCYLRLTLFLSALIINPDDGEDIFLRIIGSYKSNTVSQHCLPLANHFQNVNDIFAFNVNNLIYYGNYFILRTPRDNVTLLIPYN